MPDISAAELARERLCAALRSAASTVRSRNCSTFAHQPAVRSLSSIHEDNSAAMAHRKL